VAGNRLYQQKPIAVGIVQHNIGHLAMCFNFYA